MVHDRKYPFFTFDLDPKVTRTDFQYPLHHVTYALAKFGIATSNSLGRDAFAKNTVVDLDHGIKVTWKIFQHPLHHVTYAPAKFEALRPAV